MLAPSPTEGPWAFLPCLKSGVSWYAFMNNLPETVLQFGGGKFLRAFADLFVQHANDSGQRVGRVVVVQSTPGARAEMLNTQSGHYHVVLRGLVDGETVDTTEAVESVSRALVAQTEWEAVLAFARTPEMRIVLSNTTEKGLALDPADAPTGDAPPRSFPAKLLRVLQARQEYGLPGVAVLPCELFEANADRLLALLVEQANLWNLGAGFLDWLQHACAWHNTLVDRIVTGTPVDHPLLATDPLLTIAEPFALWAIETRPDAPAPFTDPAILPTPDVRPFLLRKVRILNGAHTALAPRALARGFQTVREAVLDPELRGWLEGLLFEEIVPTLEGRVENPALFARQTLERFANPFLEHKLSDILLYHETKQQIRLAPTREEFRVRFGRAPRRLEEALA